VLLFYTVYLTVTRSVSPDIIANCSLRDMIHSPLDRSEILLAINPLLVLAFHAFYKLIKTPLFLYKITLTYSRPDDGIHLIYDQHVVFY